MKVFIAIVISLYFLTGCGSKISAAPSGKCKDIVYTKTICPKFTAEINIDIMELNSTHAVISWRDVHKIETFVSSKKRFNSAVGTINSKN